MKTIYSGHAGIGALVGIVAGLTLSACDGSERTYSGLARASDGDGFSEPDARSSSSKDGQVRTGVDEAAAASHTGGRGSDGFQITAPFTPDTSTAIHRSSTGYIDASPPWEATRAPATYVEPADASAERADADVLDAAADSADAGPVDAADVEAGPLPTLDAECETRGEWACDIGNPAQRLICSQYRWQSNGACDQGQYCDPGSGLCKLPLAWCEAAKEGALRCTPDDELVTCGANLVSSQVRERCLGKCVLTVEAAECAPPRCGDGKVLEGSEPCDDGNADNTDSCTEICAAPYCGDGFVNNGEGCDDGNFDNTDACTQLCVAPFCGDGFVNGGETCDDGNVDNTDSCTQLCVAPFCGDGFASGGETCDDGNVDNTDSCTQLCVAPFCGDGFVNGGETCDDGNVDNDDYCTVNCGYPYCGDGFINSLEACDDGNGDNADACTQLCLTPHCGDGFVNNGEECDDGNGSDWDGCTTSCVYYWPAGGGY